MGLQRLAVDLFLCQVMHGFFMVGYSSLRSSVRLMATSGEYCGMRDGWDECDAFPPLLSLMCGFVTVTVIVTGPMYVREMLWCVRRGWSGTGLLPAGMDTICWTMFGVIPLLTANHPQTTPPTTQRERPVPIPPSTHRESQPPSQIHRFTVLYWRLVKAALRLPSPTEMGLPTSKHV